jgi:hypothetical protein
MNYINNLYTLLEIGINLGMDSEKIKRIRYLLNNKKVEKIVEEFPELEKFIPYCEWYNINNNNVLAMSAYIYDLYKDTGMLPDIKNYDLEPDVDKLEWWQYISPYVYEIDPNTGFEFAKDIIPCNVWNLFLSGSARMNYYQGESIDLQQRIKFAIVEYMLKRPQFYTTEDFYENDILLKKYRKGKIGDEDDAKKEEKTGE